MREISIRTKFKVIRLLLSGDTYDEIVEETGVAKGSVVNIVNDFREGKLQLLPPDLAEYYDQLRRLVVDLRKNQTTVTQVLSYAKIHNKLQEMGVGREQVDEWLDICRDVASETVSDSQFVKMVSQMVQVSSETGLDFRTVITHYNARLELSKELDKEIEQEKEQLKEIKIKQTEDKQRAKRELDSIREEITAAQNVFHSRKKDLEIKLDEHMTQHKLSLHKVNTVYALLRDGLATKGLSKEDIIRVSKQIEEAGSLATFMHQTQLKVDQLTRQEQILTANIRESKGVNASLQLSILNNREEDNRLEEQLKARYSRLTELKGIIRRCIIDLNVARIIIGFLALPDRLLPEEFEQLFILIASIREQRCTINGLLKVPIGTPAYQCNLPILHEYVNEFNSNLEEARTKLAFYLMLIVKDKFVPIVECQTSQGVMSILDFRGRLGPET